MRIVRALLFDVFGTCVDWRTSISREAARFGLPPELADAWRAQYQPQLETVRSGARPWVNLDVLHRIGLDMRARRPRPRPARAGPRELTLAWHRLDPWPDVVEGLTRLKAAHVIAPCSNGHIAQSVNLAKYAGLPWDAILGAEIARAYKPDPAVYLRQRGRARPRAARRLHGRRPQRRPAGGAGASGCAPRSSRARPSTARARRPTSRPRATTTSSRPTSWQLADRL